MILDEVTCRFGLYNGSNGHGGGFSSGVLLVFWVLLGSSGVPSGVLLAFFWRSITQKNARRTPAEEPRRTPEEHQKNTRRETAAMSVTAVIQTETTSDFI